MFWLGGVCSTDWNRGTGDRGNACQLEQWEGVVKALQAGMQANAIPRLGWLVNLYNEMQTSAKMCPRAHVIGNYADTPYKLPHTMESILCNRKLHCNRSRSH